jgi:hypothetical protein
MPFPTPRSGKTDPRAADPSSGMPAAIALLPASVVAFGGAGQPIEQLMALQGAIARGVLLLASIGQIRLRPSLRELPRLAFDGWRGIGRYR